MLVAEHGSLRRAADYLGVHQSVVGRRIALLESRLGILLFERDHFGSKLTDVGRKFLLDAREGTDRILQAVEQVTAVREARNGKLRIGTTTPFVSAFYQGLLTVFRARYPSLCVGFVCRPPEQLLMDIQSAQIDVAIMAGEPMHPGLATLKLWSETISLLLPKSHTLSAADSISWSVLRDERFILSAGGTGSEMRDRLLCRFSELGCLPRLDIQEICQEDVLQLVASNYGVSLGRTSVADNSNAGIAVRALDTGDTLLTSAVWLKRNSNPALKKFLAIARTKLALTVACSTAGCPIGEARAARSVNAKLSKG